MANTKRPKKQRLDQNGKICEYCGEKMVITKITEKRFENYPTIEHIYPKSDIRRFLSKQTIWVHHKCNQRKNNQDKSKINSPYPKLKYHHKHILYDAVVSGENIKELIV